MSSTPPTALDCKLDVAGVSAPSNCSPSRTHLDLFSGIGGFALAAQRTGWQTIGFSEIEPYACKILKRHWPDVPNYGDIRNVRGVRADLITGGFPCQPFSVAGKRRGASDDRALWPEMLRVIDETRPAWVLGENVAGIVNMELDRVLSDLERIGYACWPLIIPAVAVDARHRRDRAWIVAHSIVRGPQERRAENNGGVGGSHATGQATGNDVSAPPQSSENVADAHEAGWREQCRPVTVAAQHAAAERGRANTNDADSNGEPPHRAAISRAQCSLWPTEPGMGRVADGIPNRTHRLRGLGNSIVPQVAEALMREMAWMENAPAHRPAQKEETL